MISEVAFARDFASFWRQTTPTMDGFVRRLNRGEYVRDFIPMTFETAPNRRAFVNGVAFAGFCIIVREGKIGKAIQVNNAIEEAAPAVATLALGDLREGNYDVKLSDVELMDVKEQIHRLQLRLLSKHEIKAVVCQPRFQGCGIVDRCEGDVLVTNVLFEIKAGDRPFRSIDLRQILTYLALNRASALHDIQNIGAANPRVGISFEMPIEEFCYEVSGRDAASLTESIIYGMSSGEVSR